MRSKSFMKWLGGKARFASEIVKHFPQEIDTYCEPFLGAGSVFFELASQNRIKKLAVLSDSCIEVVSAWIAVKHNPEELCSLFSKTVDTKEEFISIRDQRKENLTTLERGFRLIFLTNQAYGAAYRETIDGKCTSTWSPVDAARPRKEYRIQKIRHASELINSVPTLIGQAHALEQIIIYADADALYIDPPYIDTAGKGHRYGTQFYGKKEDERLRNILTGTRFSLISNAIDTPMATDPRFYKLQDMRQFVNGMKGANVEGVYKTEFRDALYGLTTQKI